MIKINCNCGLTHEVDRDKNAPDTAISMGCNYCPDCMGDMTEEYNEWYNYPDKGDDYGDDPNQLMLFSVADDILANHKVKEVKELTE